MPLVELEVRRTHLWKELGQEKVSSVEHSGPPNLLCLQTVDFGHATSISSHKDRSRNLRFLDLHADKILTGL